MVNKINQDKQVKDKHGGWEAFLRAHAPDEYSVVAGMVRQREQPAAGTMGDVEVMSVQQQPRAAEDTSRGTINALSLDAAAL